MLFPKQEIALLFGGRTTVLGTEQPVRQRRRRGTRRGRRAAARHHRPGGARLYLRDRREKAGDDVKCGYFCGYREQCEMKSLNPLMACGSNRTPAVGAGESHDCNRTALLSRSRTAPRRDDAGDEAHHRQLRDQGDLLLRDPRQPYLATFWRWQLTPEEMAEARLTITSSG